MRNRRALPGLAALAVAGALVLAACMPQTPVGHNSTPVRGYAELSPQQMAHYVNVVYWNAGGSLCGGLPYRASVSPLALAMYFVDEGNAQYIRGDIAWAQSILETGWFAFCGSVPPGYNNFAGIGATGSSNGCHPVPAPPDICRFSHASIGARAQMQRLNRYANPADAWSLARPLVAQRGWLNAAQYNSFFIQGTRPTWQSLTGTWATDPCYDTKVMRIYNDMRAFSGMAKFPVTAKQGC